MGTYADLSQEDKDILAGWERNQRAWFNSAARLLVEARALQASIDAAGGPRDIVTGLDNGEKIPNSGALAGGHDMTKQEWASLIAIMDEYVTNNDTAADRQLFAKAAGPTAGL